jgi:hypothetical protein
VKSCPRQDFFISYPYETAFPLHLSFCWHSTGFASPILCVLW